METKTKTKAYLAAVSFSVIIGLSFLFLKMALTAADPLNALAHRFTVGFIAASVPVALGWVRLNIKLRDVLAILPLALFYPAAYFTLQVFGLVYSTSSEAGIIQATVPIFTMILAAFLIKEQTSALQKLSVVVSVAGVVFIFAMKGVDLHSASAIGSILLLISALSLAGYNVLGKKLLRQFGYKEITYVMIAFAFVFFNAVSVVQHISAGTITQYFEPFASPVFVLSILYLGLLSSIVTSLLSNYALSHLEASKMSVFSHLSTLVSVSAGVIFLHEQLAYFHLVGAVLIIAGIVGTNLGKRKIPSTGRVLPAKQGKRV